MTPTPDEIRSIYREIGTRPGLSLDTQGWNYSTALFRRIITQIRPKVIVEVGVWKGASIIHMASLCAELKLPTILYGVDAWFGHAGDALGNAPQSQIPRFWPNPTYYEQFLYHVKASGYDNRIIPVWQLTRWGALCLKTWGVEPDVIYIDAAHDTPSILSDLQLYWPLLAKGGVMFGDDYAPEFGVPAAVQEFAMQIKRPFNIEGGQWSFDPK